MSVDSFEVGRRAWFTLKGLQGEIADMVMLRNREVYRVARCGNFKKVLVLVQEVEGSVEEEMKFIGTDHGQKFFYSDGRKAFYSGPTSPKRRVSTGRHTTVVAPLEEAHVGWIKLVRAIIVSQKKDFGSEK